MAVNLNFRRKDWQTGEVIKEQFLDNIEAGIEEAHTAIKKIDSDLDTVSNDISVSNDMQFGSYDGCVVSFVSDDGQEFDYSIWYEQIFKPEGVPANACLITSGRSDITYGTKMGWNKCRELKKAGWTVGSHSHTHINITGKTEKEIYDDLLESKKLLIQNKLDDDIYVSPFGGYNEYVDNVARRLFRCHFTTGYKFTNGASDIDGTGKTNIMDNYNIYRRNGIGETASGYEVTKENMIEDIEYAKENKLWLIFCMHSHYEKFRTGTGVQELREVIQYCKNNNIPIMNLKDAFRLKGNKVDLGNRNVKNNWLRIDCNGKESKAVNISNNTSTTDASNYFKIATLESKSKYLDFGLTFQYYVTNISGNDGNTNSGQVTATFRNTGSKIEKLFINNIVTASKLSPVSFVAKYIEVTENTCIVEIYAKLNKNYSAIQIFNEGFIQEDTSKTFIEMNNDKTFVASLTFDATANNFGKTYLYDKTPDFASTFKGQMVVDTNNKKAYISYDTGYNKWIHLTGQTGVFTPVIKGEDVAGNHTYTIQEGKYTKFGNMVNFNLKIQGTFDGTQTGNIVIDGLPFSANGSASVSVGYQSGFGNNSLRYAYVNGGKKIILNKINSTTGSTNQIIGSECSGNFNIWISGTYTCW